MCRHQCVICRSIKQILLTIEGFINWIAHDDECQKHWIGGKHLMFLKKISINILRNLISEIFILRIRKKIGDQRICLFFVKWLKIQLRESPNRAHHVTFSGSHHILIKRITIHQLRQLRLKRLRIGQIYLISSIQQYLALTRLKKISGLLLREIIIKPFYSLHNIICDQIIILTEIAKLYENRQNTCPLVLSD